MISTSHRKTNVSVGYANAVGVLFLIIIAVIVTAAFIGIWGIERLAAGFDVLANTNPLILLAGLFISIAVHELLHGVGFVMGGMRWRDVKFGVFWQALTPYATSPVPMRVHTYRVATSLPGLVLGLLPTVTGVVTGHGAVTLYGAFMLAAAGGDAIVLWVTRHLAKDVLVRDCHHAVGCEVIESEA